MGNISREERAGDLELAYRAGFNTAIIISVEVCNKRKRKHLEPGQTGVHRDLALEAEICGAEIECLKKPSGPKMS